jgi:hypothetical protein
VIYLDADNIPLRDPAFLFESSEYNATGALLWQDFWDNTMAPEVGGKFTLQAAGGGKFAGARAGAAVAGLLGQHDGARGGTFTLRQGAGSSRGRGLWQDPH